MPRNYVAHELAGPDGHRGLVGDDRVPFHGLADAFGDRLDGPEIRLTVRFGRRADRDEDYVGPPDADREIRPESQAAVGDVARHHLLEPRLIDGHTARAEDGNLLNVLVDADHVVAEVGEDRPRDKPDVSGPNHADVHDKRSRLNARLGIRNTVNSKPSPPESDFTEGGHLIVP